RTPARGPRPPARSPRSPGTGAARLRRGGAARGVLRSRFLPFRGRTPRERALGYLRSNVALYVVHERNDTPGRAGGDRPRCSRLSAARMRFSDTGAWVPRVWANRLTLSSSSIHRTSVTPG